jgi:DNA-binding NarL/FixJ family response regulator
LASRNPTLAALARLWARRGEAAETFGWMVRPFILEIQGEWQAAADEWRRLDCPYEQARALAQSDTEAQTAALTIFETLGARPMIETVQQKLRDAGVQSLPRGPRPATKANTFHLTNRQLEILTLLMEDLTNAEIAARLHTSAKTVDHHVSAVLANLNVSLRTEAAVLARQHTDL